MTLNEAKEKLTAEKEVAKRTGQRTLYAALQLGIEALKRVQEDEYRGTEVPRPLLPGETEE